MRKSILAGVALALTLTACGGNSSDAQKSETPSAPATLKSVSQIPDARIVDKNWATYRTAEVTEVDKGPTARTLDVNYKAGADNCSGFAGYAAHFTKTEVQVTIIMGEKSSCPGKGTQRTTVLPLSKDIGKRKPTISVYSQQPIPIKKA